MSSYYRGGRGFRGGGGFNYARGRGRFADPVRGDGSGNAEGGYEPHHTRPHRSSSFDEGSEDERFTAHDATALRQSTPAQPRSALESFLRNVDGSNYSQLKQLTGSTYQLTPSTDPDEDPVTLRFLRIQPDPFAPGSQVRVRMPAPFSVQALLRSSQLAPPPGMPQGLALPPDDVACRRVAAEDFLFRCVKRGLAARHTSGALQILHLSQHVLPRSVVQLVDEDSATGGNGSGSVHVSLRVKLPGHGRRIDSRGIQHILFTEVLTIMQEYVLRCDHRALWAHVTCVHEQEWLRGQLRGRGLVAFVADGAVLPRAGGNSDKPLEGPGVIPFRSPPTLSQTFRLPYSGRVLSGAGVPQGLTLIAGGGFHGKSTLLRALELGVYNHVPDDGRTFVVTDPTAVKIRAEDRRAVHGVDISPFITNLPFRDDTCAFSTVDASGSTSQAANIMEALELGSTALLLDEDTCATNFMYRDALMEQLVPRTQEPITAFVHRVRDLIFHHGVSVVMVVGGSGQYFPLADVVLTLNAYRITDATADAKAIVAQCVENGEGGKGGLLMSVPPPARSAFQLPPQRSFLYKESFDRFNGQGRPSTYQQQQQQGYGGRGGGSGIKISGVGVEHIRMADEDINLTLVEQLVEEGQLNAIAQCLAMMFDDGAAAVARWQTDPTVLPPPYPPSLLGGESSRGDAAEVGTTLASKRRSDFCRLVYQCEARLRQARLELQTQSCYLPAGFTALPRVFEIGAALNRLRTLVTFCR